MSGYSRHVRIWRGLQFLLRGWITRRFCLESEPIRTPGPILLIANHVTAWDPLLLAVALGEKHVYYVASEHILRSGFPGKIIGWLLAPIPRRKGASGRDTVKSCMNHLQAGHSVCLFAEGEQSWDGRSIPVVEGTGSLVRHAGATLVTYRLEGGYLSLPRWGKGLRRGRVRGRVAGVYPPELLTGMTKEEINRLLNRDIRENAWNRQIREPEHYRGKRQAESLERFLYLCPGCGCIGTLKSKNDRLQCPCGLDLRFTDMGFFDPSAPFSTLPEWEDWQKRQLKARKFMTDLETGCLFSDEDTALVLIGPGHRQEALGNGRIAQYEDALECAGRRFELDGIQDMAMTQANRLLFTFGDGYYQIRCRGNTNLRKYLEIWKESKN